MHFLLHLTLSVIFHNSLSFAQESVPGNLTDFSVCKVSHLGLEYSGDVSKTEGGVRCQSWSAANPIHKIDSAYGDDRFPEFSRKGAKNRCRNPSGDVKGPWCYTMDPRLMDDTCAIPLCSLSQCKLTGPGMEFGGDLNHGVSGKLWILLGKKSFVDWKLFRWNRMDF